jgi:hypothetical protein
MTHGSAGCNEENVSLEPQSREKMGNSPSYQPGDAEPRPYPALKADRA